MGGRVAAECTRQQTDSTPLLLGVFCISYPLHKPKQKDTLRTSHLKDITEIPLLIINGTQDIMCDYVQMEKVFKLLHNNWKTIHWVKDADHSLMVKGCKKNDDICNDFSKVLVDWCLNCVKKQ